MTRRSDWWPGARTEQLAMAQNWVKTLSNTYKPWKIDTVVMQTFTDLTVKADTALREAQSESTRTPVATAKCKAAFAQLKEAARDIKKRYFHVPPLVDADLVSLGLKPRDTTPTPSGTPAAQVTIETYLVGRRELGLRFIYLTGSADDKANKGCRVFYRVTAQGEPEPQGPDDLHNSFFTKRKKDILRFEYGDSGKICYMAVQVENDSKKGPWGPMVNALIP